MPEQRSVWQRIWSQLNWLDGLDYLLYGGLGLALLGYAIYSVAVALHKSGHVTGLVCLLVVVILSVAALVRDLRRKSLSPLSKGLVGAWAACVVVVIIAELIVSFS